MAHPGWQPIDYHNHFIKKMEERIATAQSIATQIGFDRTRWARAGREIPDYGSVVWNNLLPYPILTDDILRLGPVAIQVLDKFGIVWDTSTRDILTGDGSRGYLKTMDIVNMPSLSAIQLSCAERIIDEKIVECKINEYGIAEFYYVSRDQDPGYLDIRWWVPADQYTPAFDLVVVTGYDPPAYRWFGNWDDYMKDEREKICPADEISCGGDMECLEASWTEEAYVTFRKPILVGSVFDDMVKEVYELEPPFDSHIGTAFAIDQGGDNLDHDVTMSETTRFFQRLPGITVTEYDETDVNDRCGRIPNPYRTQAVS